MTHKASSNHLYKLTSRIAVVALSLLSLNATGNSQTVRQDPRIFGGPERRLYNGVPTKLPLKFDVKNVISQRWVHDLEVEVTNTSDKPIYYMDMYVFMSGVKFQGKQMGFWLHYGRVKLVDFSEPLLPEDVPIKPGGKHTFKIDEGDAKSWDSLRSQEGKAEPKNLELLFQRINFGDGTGFQNTAGEPVNIHQEVSRAGPWRTERVSRRYPKSADCFLRQYGPESTRGHRRT